MEKHHTCPVCRSKFRFALFCDDNSVARDFIETNESKREEEDDDRHEFLIEQLIDTWASRRSQGRSSVSMWTDHPYIRFNSFSFSRGIEDRQMTSCPKVTLFAEEPKKVVKPVASSRSAFYNAAQPKQSKHQNKFKKGR
jgi:hypothetical protein